MSVPVVAKARPTAYLSTLISDESVGMVQAFIDGRCEVKLAEYDIREALEVYLGCLLEEVKARYGIKDASIIGDALALDIPAPQATEERPMHAGGEWCRPRGMSKAELKALVCMCPDCKRNRGQQLVQPIVDQLTVDIARIGSVVGLGVVLGVVVAFGLWIACL